MSKDRFGFSTGALEKGDYRAALKWIGQHELRSIELSALRFEELAPLVDDLDKLKMNDFEYVSFHAPSSFRRDQEERVVSLLTRVAHRRWNIIVHPDVIYTPARWKQFGDLLLIENMDRRKSTGRTVSELTKVFDGLPQARMCLDVAHARQLDTTLTLLHSLVAAFIDRIAEVHISELDSRCHHRLLSRSSVDDYTSIASRFYKVPVIIESMLDHESNELRERELNLAQLAMESPTGSILKRSTCVKEEGTARAR